MVHRRSLLAGCAATLTTITAGCAGMSGNQSDYISLSSRVTNQATETEPPTIELQLQNESSRTLILSSNDRKPLTVFPRLKGSTGSVVALPKNVTGVDADVSSSPDAGCWRFVTPDGETPEIDIAMRESSVRLSAGDTFGVRHRLYYEGDGERCFPDGEYTNSQAVTVESTQGGDVRESTVEVVVTAAKNGISDVSVTGPL